MSRSLFLHFSRFWVIYLRKTFLIKDKGLCWLLQDCYQWGWDPVVLRCQYWALIVGCASWPIWETSWLRPRSSNGIDFPVRPHSTRSFLARALCWLCLCHQREAKDKEHRRMFCFFLRMNNENWHHHRLIMSLIFSVKEREACVSLSVDQMHEALR